MSFENQQIQKVKEEERMKKTALLHSMDMKYGNYVSETTQTYNDRMKEILEEIDILKKATKIKETKDRLDYLSEQYAEIEKLLKVNIEARQRTKENNPGLN